MFTQTLIDTISRSAMISTWHVVVLLLVVLLVFGPSRLPELSRALGRSIKDFKKGISEVKDEIDSANPLKEEPARAPARLSVPVAAPVQSQTAPADQRTPGQGPTAS